MSDQPDEPLVDLEYGEPIHAMELEEVCQLLGYEWRDVVSLHIDARRVRVTTVHVERPADLRDVVHVHTVV